MSSKPAEVRTLVKECVQRLIKSRCNSITRADCTKAVVELLEKLHALFPDDTLEFIVEEIGPIPFLIKSNYTVKRIDPIKKSDEHCLIFDIGFCTLRTAPQTRPCNTAPVHGGADSPTAPSLWQILNELSQEVAQSAVDSDLSPMMCPKPSFDAESSINILQWLLQFQTSAAVGESAPPCAVPPSAVAVADLMVRLYITTMYFGKVAQKTENNARVLEDLWELIQKVNKLRWFCVQSAKYNGQLECMGTLLFATLFDAKDDRRNFDGDLPVEINIVGSLARLCIFRNMQHFAKLVENSLNPSSSNGPYALHWSIPHMIRIAKAKNMCDKIMLAGLSLVHFMPKERWISGQQWALECDAMIEKYDRNGATFDDSDYVIVTALTSRMKFEENFKTETPILLGSVMKMLLAIATAAAAAD